MKNLFPIILLLLILGCAEHQDLKIGTYKSVRISPMEQGYLYLTSGIRSCFIGSSIVLSKDSSFSYTTCGNIMTGNWRKSSDSLFLLVKTNRWRSDSLNKTGYNGTWPKVPVKAPGFKISDDYLICIHRLKEGSKGIEKLRYSMP
jgi:hypothetical protein